MTGPATPLLVASGVTSIIGGFMGKSASRRAGQSQAHLMQMQYENDLLSAQTGVSLAGDYRGHQYAMADQIMELANARLAISQFTSEYELMRGEQARDVSYQAGQYALQQGREAYAIGTHGAVIHDKTTKEIESLGTAAIVAGGGAVSDVVNEISEASAESEYNALVSLYTGNKARKEAQYANRVYKYEGDVAKISSEYNSALILAEGYYQFNQMGLEAENMRFGGDQAYRNAQYNLQVTQAGGPGVSAAQQNVIDQYNTQGDIALITGAGRGAGTLSRLNWGTESKRPYTLSNRPRGSYGH